MTLPYIPTITNKALLWALDHMTVTTDEIDEYGYIFRATITINKPHMIREIRDYIRKNTEYKMDSYDSKRGNTFTIKTLEDLTPDNERESFIAVAPNNEIRYTYTSAKKP